MRPELISQPITGICSFGRYPICLDLDELKADFGVLGVPFDMPCVHLQRHGSRLGRPLRQRDDTSRYRPQNRGGHSNRDHQRVGRPCG